MGYRLKQRALNLTLAIGARLEVAKLAQLRHARAMKDNRCNEAA